MRLPPSHVARSSRQPAAQTIDDRAARVEERPGSARRILQRVLPGRGHLPRVQILRRAPDAIAMDCGT